VGISSAFEKNVYGTIRHITVYDSEVEQVQNLVKRAYLGYKAGFALYDAEVLIDFDPIDEKGMINCAMRFLPKRHFLHLKI
jgi:hypothetical protein